VRSSGRRGVGRSVNAVGRSWRSWRSVGQHIGRSVNTSVGRSWRSTRSVGQRGHGGRSVNTSVGRSRPPPTRRDASSVDVTLSQHSSLGPSSAPSSRARASRADAAAHVRASSSSSSSVVVVVVARRTRTIEIAMARDRVGKFLCVVPPKTLKVCDATGARARAHGRDALEDALGALEFKASSSALEGGGVAIGVGPGIQAFTDNELIVSFVGHLTNVDYLAWRLFSDEGRRGESAPATALEAARQLVGGRCYEAELVCHLYKTFGTKALPKLRGKFAFVCYDSKSVRVFAARDASGEYELKYARDEVDGTVVVANFDGASAITPSKQPMLDVPPGCYIYGHRSITPNRFAKTVEERSSELAAAAAAAAIALRGLNVKSRRSQDVTRRSSDARAPAAEEEIESHMDEDAQRALKSLDGGHEFESHDRAADVEDVEPGTIDDHIAAESVAIKAASAAIKRIASGANMSGMVRMDSLSALSAFGKSHMNAEGNDSEFKLNRVPSRSGLLSDMVKVASFGNLKNIEKVGSLSDLAHAGATASPKHLGKTDRRGSWQDLSLLVVSGTTNGERANDLDEKNSGGKA